MADRRSFERGLLYAANGRVGKRTVTELSLTTMVRGSASYKVKLWIGAEETTFNCSCLSGFEGGFCKDVVAVALVMIGAVAAGNESRRTSRSCARRTSPSAIS